MLDAKLRRYIDPPLNMIGAKIAALGIGATSLTLSGLAFGLLGAVAIAHGYIGWGLAFIAINRLFDGLDGAVARVNGASDFGGYLDIVADFAFYVSIPTGFGFLTEANQLPALFLVACFILPGISFLSFAVIAEKRGLQTEAHGKKSFFYNSGLAEGTETITCFVLMCLFPAYFAVIAWGYAALCILTVIQRSIIAYIAFR